MHRQLFFLTGSLFNEAPKFTLLLGLGIATQQRRICRQMHAQCPGPHRKTQTCASKRLPIEIDVDWCWRFNLEPRYPGTYRYRVDTQQAAAKQRAERTDSIGRRRHDTHIQQPIVDRRLRAQ